MVTTLEYRVFPGQKVILVYPISQRVVHIVQVHAIYTKTGKNNKG